jgi:hypothetical protein
MENESTAEVQILHLGHASKQNMDSCTTATAGVAGRLLLAVCSKLRDSLTFNLFKKCSFSRMIWEKVATWIEAPALMLVNWIQIDDLGQWFIEMENSGQQTRRQGVR